MSPPVGLPSRTGGRGLKPTHDASKTHSPIAATRRRSARHLPKRTSADTTDSARSSISSDSGPSLSTSPVGMNRDHPSSSIIPSFQSSIHPQSALFSSEESLPSDGPAYTAKDKGKAVASDVDNLPPPNTLPLLCPPRMSSLGPTMQSSQVYRSINLHATDPDEPPRLITYTKSAQGFTWNEELFLPSYMISRYSRGRRKQYDGDMGEDEEVTTTEIYVTDDDLRRYYG
ncbi:MAG: hypothetical protein Q9160_000302 [Pyrenula sp. 1 TL-2023]